MVDKLFLSVVAALLSLSQATQINFPASGQACILVDITTDNELTWIDKDGKETPIPRFTLNNSFPIDGSCDSPPFVMTRWMKDDATFTFAFSQDAGKASVNMTLRFTPNNVFKNGETDPVSLSMVKKLGPVDKAYMCDEGMDYTVQSTAGDNKYKLDFGIKNIKIQGYNVKKGVFSDAEECDDSMTTESKRTSAPNTKPSEQTTQKDHTSHPTPKETTKPPVTTEPPTTKPSTKPPVTTEPPTTKPPVTTEPPTTKPPVTTEPPTTKPTTKPVTTEPPTTAPPTTPTPTPRNHPSNTFKVFSKNNSVNCIYMKGEFLFTLPYPKKDNTTGMAPFGVQDIKSVNGECNNTGNVNVLNVNFYKNWTMMITFATDKPMMLGDDSSKDFWWSKLDVTYSYDMEVFKDVDPKQENNMTTIKTTFADHQFQGSMSSSYLCNSDTGVSLNNSAKLDTYHLQYNAFQTTNNQTAFNGEPSQCSADASTNKIVPIAVGAALAGLVVIVLIAYLIGRRRNRRGYESV